MGTKKLSAAGQAELDLGDRRRVTIPLDTSILFAKASFLGALMYVIECGNFERDKEIYQPLGIDPGNWSRIRRGDMSFPQEKEELLQALCGNRGLVLWRAHRAGMGVYDLTEAKDKIIAERDARISELERDIETLRRYHQIIIGK